MTDPPRSTCQCSCGCERPTAPPTPEQPASWDTICTWCYETFGSIETHVHPGDAEYPRSRAIARLLAAARKVDPSRWQVQHHGVSVGGASLTSIDYYDADPNAMTRMELFFAIMDLHNTELRAAEAEPSTV